MAFFYDEYRCPVYVKDVVFVILTLIDKWLSGMKLLNVLLLIILIIDCEKLLQSFCHSCFKVLVLMKDFNMIADWPPFKYLLASTL